MKLADQRDIHAPQEAVWAGITDPDTLKQCIPGCQEMTGSVEDGFEAVVVQKVGPVKASFRGAVTVTDVVEGESCTLTGEGKGGPAGFAKGEAKVALSEIPEGTRLAYEVEAKVGGKLAQLGGRVVDGVAGRMADQFFDRFKEVVEGSSTGSGSGSGSPTASPAGDEEGAAPATAGADASPTGARAAADARPTDARPTGVQPTEPQPTEPQPTGAEAGGAGPIGGGPGDGEPAGADGEKKGWLRRLISRDNAAET